MTGDYKVNYGYISSKLEQMGVAPNKIVLDRTICIHGFSFKKLWALRKSNLTIFAMNCWGGYVYHQMGMPFRTPFINMFEAADDWIRFLKTPQQYMSETLKFIRWNQRKVDPAPYPVFSLGDVQIHMNHYSDVEYAEKKWMERKERINWSNILVEAQLNDVKKIREFISLPYYKKACFTSLDVSKENAVFYIDMNRWDIRKFIEHNIVDYKNLTEANKIDWTVLRFAEGKVYFYDLFDLLLYGVKTPINNMIFNY